MSTLVSCIVFRVSCYTNSYVVKFFFFSLLSIFPYLTRSPPCIRSTTSPSPIHYILLSLPSESPSVGLHSFLVPVHVNVFFPFRPTGISPLCLSSDSDPRMSGFCTQPMTLVVWSPFLYFRLYNCTRSFFLGNFQTCPHTRLPGQRIPSDHTGVVQRSGGLPLLGFRSLGLLYPRILPSFS